ncbi:DUF1365 domain-containing protein [Jannaschia aquimarina]|uniref:Cyclopropane-fatty-acyl-phospholipid synthase n=1 Tax=Jannaschia aquimarina TaxID=935700 RepID=A0A0D1EEN5_9RHOB|nr:DUF1365 domain-containing protein [Jannaschia aquimarina]KIT15316.1 hypothetical protein jaqu_29310 [Jannaschia aquimarina]SNS51096.1 hypothetical protein SAMN05421775_101245 [Jannaschia aquimarina]
MSRTQHIPARTFHGREEAPGVRNAFTYGVDYVLLEPEATPRLPWPMRLNARAPVSLWASDHGGPPGKGTGTAWVRRVLDDLDAPVDWGRIDLLAQPRVLGHVFNPVSFWLCHDTDGVLRLVIPEVTNTYGDRHSYLVHADGFAAITPEMRLTARKSLHVSPFQPVEGGYTFRFDFRDDHIGIWIDYRHQAGRLLATLAGPRRALTTGGLLRAMARRPFGSRRVLGLIHWQALKLWWKGAPFRTRPTPPAQEVSR